MNPQYTSASLAEYYTRYTTRDPARIMNGYRKSRMERTRLNLRLLMKFMKKEGRFFSIGCGDGLELVLARDLGLKVEAFDVDPITAAAVQTATGIPVLTDDLFEMALPRSAYDGVFLDQVLEHPKKPADYLRLIHELLVPGGICYIGVPNIGSISNRWKAIRDLTGLRPRAHVGRQYDSWHHLHYYQPRSFRKVLEPLFGLRIVAILGDPLPTWNAMAYHLRRTVPLFDSNMVVIAQKIF